MRKSFQKNKKREEREAFKKKFYMTILGTFIIGVMVISLFAYPFFYSSGSPQANQRVEEYGVEFSVVNIEGSQALQAEFDGEEFQFYRLPSDVAGYFTDKDAEDVFTQAPAVLITFDPLAVEPQIAQAYLSQFAQLTTQKTLGFGVVRESPDYVNATIISCDNATDITPVLEFGLTNVTEETGLLVNGNCLTLKSTTPQDLYFLTEKLRFIHHGINFRALN